MPGERARSALAGTRFADIRWTGQTGSTNADVLELARSGVPEGVVLVTDHQRAGRGRLGRSWEAPPGSSLLVSVLLRPTVPLDRVHTATMAMGLSAADSCEEVAGCRPRLKWPNDLVVGDRKLGGILAESTVTGASLDALVVGLGLNVNWPAELPENLAEVAVALNHLTGEDVDREDLLIVLLDRLDRWYASLVDGQTDPDGERLMAAYRSSSATLGQRVRVELAGERFEGEAVGVTDEGHLVVDVDGEARVVAAGDVVHLRPAG